MPEKSASVHPLFDPSSKYGRMRASLRPEGKMRGYVHFLWSRAKHEAEPLPIPTGLSREEGLERACRLAGISGCIDSVAFSPDGRLIATGSEDEPAQLWDATSGECLRTLAGHGRRVSGVAFSPDGRRLATASEDNTARLWDASSGECLRSLAGHGRRVSGVAFSPDGRRLATASEDNTARLWDATSGECLRTLAGHGGAVGSVAFSPDGRWLATASLDGTARLWDASSGECLRTLAGHGDWVHGVAFSPDGRRLATASGDHTARLWDASSGECLRTLSGHGDPVEGVAFSPDGRRLATASWDSTARLWDASSGECLRTLAGHGKWVNGVAFSPDGRRLATASDDMTARLWDLDTGEGRIITEHGPDFRVLDVCRARAALVLPETDRQPIRTDREAIELCLVREADGRRSLGCLADMDRLLHYYDMLLDSTLRRSYQEGHAVLRCRAFLLEPEVVARLQSLMGDKPWLHAFQGDVIADNFEVARILSAAPEMEGELRETRFVFERIPVPDCYDVLPPRKEPLHVVIVIDWHQDAPATG